MTSASMTTFHLYLCKANVFDNRVEKAVQKKKQNIFFNI